MEDQTPATDTIAPSQPVSVVSQPKPTFLGNTHDLMAVVGSAAAGIVLLCCATGGYGMYCLPIAPIILGLLAVINSKQAIDPERTRRWGWVSVGVGGIVLVFIIVVFVVFILIYVAMIYLTFQLAPQTFPPRR